MPELRYHDRQLSPFPGMGASFSSAAIGLQRLKMMEQQRQEEQYYRNLELGMQGQRLGVQQQQFGLEKQEAEQKMSKEKMLMDAAKEYSQAVKSLYRPQYRGEGPPSPIASGPDRAEDVQRGMSALALIAAQNPGAASKMMEPQQFNRGPVYGPMDTDRQDLSGVKPAFDVPAPPESDRERAMRGMAMRNASLRSFDAKRRDTTARLSLQERIRHDKAGKSEQGSDLTELLRRAAGGGKTNAPSSAPITARNPDTGQRIRSLDGGKTWEPLNE